MLLSLCALRIGLFVVYTLTPSAVNERQICMDGDLDLTVTGKIFLRCQCDRMTLTTPTERQLWDHFQSEGVTKEGKSNQSREADPKEKHMRWYFS